MELDHEELEALARFIARRMGPEVLLDPTDPPPSSDRATAWTVLLEEAHARGELGALLRRVAAERPDDDRLQEACRLLIGEPPRARGLRVPRVAVAVALAALIGVAVLVGPRPAPAPEPEPIRVELALQPQSVEAEEPVVLASARPAEPVAAQVALEDAVAGSVEEAEVTRAGDALADAGDARVGDGGAGDCGARPGELVGYWYAGERPPGSAGEVVVMPHAVNVRADYPDADNQFDARAPVRCVIGAGTRVRLSADPIPVPRESWWVPLVSGDVVSDRTG